MTGLHGPDINAMQNIATPATSDIASTFLNTFSTSIDKVENLNDIPDTPEFNGE